SADSPDALFSCRLHAPRRDRGHRFPEQSSRLRHSVPSSSRGVVHHRRRSQTSWSRDRLFRRAAHLGTETALSSPPTLCRPGWRNLAEWQPLDCVSPPFLPARTRAVVPVPAIVPEISAGCFRRRQTHALLFT